MSTASRTPRVTVTIPTFNRKNLLGNAIQSALDQDCDEMIVHVWDNHSTDGTKDFMEDLVRRIPQVRYTRRPENIGALRNYPDALAHVETEFYVGLADDDLLLPGYLERGLKEFDEDPSLGAVVMQTVHVSPDGSETWINPDARWRYGRMAPAEMLEQWTRLGHFEWSSILFSKKAFDSVGGIDVGIGLPADVDFQMRVFMSFSSVIIPQRAAVMNIHEGQTARSIGLDLIDAQHRIEEKLDNYTRTHMEFRIALRQLKSRFFMSYLYIAHNAGSFQQLRNICSRIWRSQTRKKPGVIVSCVLVWMVVRFGLSHLLTGLDRMNTSRNDNKNIT